MIPVKVKKIIADNRNEETIMGWANYLDYLNVNLNTELNYSHIRFR